MRLVTLLLLLSPRSSAPFRPVPWSSWPRTFPYVIRAQQSAPSSMAIEVLEEAARRLGEPLGSS